MTRTLFVTLLLTGLVVSVPSGFARAEGEPWADEQAFKDLVKFEVKTLRGLLKVALKKEYRRQAWYLADRLAAIDPSDAKAIDVLEKWSGKELQLGSAPKKAYVKKRDNTLRGLGDQYFHFGETLEASGMDPEKYFPINVRAHAYGSKAGPLLAAIKQANYVWLGTYGPQPQAEVEKCLRGSFEDFVFPEGFQDDYLSAKVLWPEARGAEWQAWRLMTDHDYKEALRLLGMLAHAEQWMTRNLGSRAGRKIEHVTNLYVFSEWQKYDKIGVDLLHERHHERFTETSGYYDNGYRRLLVCWRHRFNGWLGDDDLMLGHASKVMARRHLGAGAGGEVWGKGAWLLEGLRGAFEGFRLDQDGKGEIDPASCWRLAAARAIRDEGNLIPWKEFFELNRREAEKIERPTLTIKFGGAEREAKKVDVVAAQATALVVGLIKADKGKCKRKLGKLIGDLYKRDSLPDIQKVLGVKMDRVIAMAEVAMEAAHGLESK